MGLELKATDRVWNELWLEVLYLRKVSIEALLTDQPLGFSETCGISQNTLYFTMMFWKLYTNTVWTIVSLYLPIPFYLWCCPLMRKAPAWSPKAFRPDQASFGSANHDTHGHMHPTQICSRTHPVRGATQYYYVMSTLAPWACGFKKKRILAFKKKKKKSIYEAKHMTQWSRALTWHENCVTLHCSCC